MASSFKGWGTSWGSSWGELAPINPGAMSGTTAFSFTATGDLTAISAASKGGSNKPSRKPKPRIDDNEVFEIISLLLNEIC